MLTEGEKEFVEAFSEWVSAEGVECGFTGGGFRLRCGDSPLSRSERTVTLWRPRKLLGLQPSRGIGCNSLESFRKNFSKTGVFVELIGVSKST